MSKKEVSFEVMAAELEEILEKISLEATPLDESIDLYAKAAQLLQQCNERLAKARIKIDEIGEKIEEVE